MKRGEFRTQDDDTEKHKKQSKKLDPIEKAQGPVNDKQDAQALDAAIQN